MQLERNNLTVLMVASSYPRYEGDTASIFLRHLARSISNSGISVHVLAPNDRLVDRQAEDDVRVHWFNYFPRCPAMLAYGSGILPNIRQYPWLVLQIPFFVGAMFLSLFTQSRKLRPNIIHAHWILPAGLIAVTVGRLLNIPVVVTAHGGDAFSIKGRLSGTLKKLALNNARAWTANTAATAAAASARQTETQAEIIPMGVDVDRFEQCRTDQLHVDREQETPLVLFVGRLVEKKGVRYLIEALAELVKKRSLELKLWIVGDGELSGALQKLADRLGVSTAVRFVGAVPNSDLPRYYASADLFVAPSVIDQRGDTEGQGVVIVEAMASGTPVLASNVGGIADVLTDGVNGILFEPENSMALADAIEHCLTQDHKSLVANALSEAKSRYDWPVVAKRFTALYRNVAHAYP